MAKPVTTAVPATALDYDSTIVTVVELSDRSWIVGAQVPGVARRSRHGLKPRWEDLVELLDRLRRRAERAGKRADRVVLAYEAGRVLAGAAAGRAWGRGLRDATLQHSG